jgi:hypothetical protein
MKEFKKSNNVADKKKEGEIEVNLDSLSLESDDKLTFIPLKNDGTDEETRSLFEQLEDEKAVNRGADIMRTIKEGANLWAKRTFGEFEGSYPIHIAAYNLGNNSGAVTEILQSFSDPSERKEYMLLEDGEENNLLDILLTSGNDWYMPIDVIECMLSYLKPEEQLKFVKRALKKHEDLFEDSYALEPIKEIFDNIEDGKYINLCEQRRREESVIQAGYDSGDEGLGALDEVNQNKSFTARVSYKETKDADGRLKSTPTLELIPSNWRLETATSDSNQGDHVIAYVLLLNSLAHCKGENIKTLPQLLCDTFCAVLPDHKKSFMKAQSTIEEKLKQQSAIRRDALASLKEVCGKSEDYLNALEDSLKKAEIEEVARHVEKMADKFIGAVNLIKGESFPQSRKNGTLQFISTGMQVLVDKETRLDKPKYNSFKKIIKDEIESYLKAKIDDKKQRSKMIIGKDLSSISDSIIEKATKDKVITPESLSSKKKMEDFLVSIAPLKKYHEGHAIKEISRLSKSIKASKEEDEKVDCGDDLHKIGQFCSQLFDYPKVNKPDQDDVRVLYEAIPRHMIIIFASFGNLRTLELEEKKVIYDSFLDQVLKLQLWEGHPVFDEKDQDVLLSKDILKNMVLQYSDIDTSFNFSMKPSLQHPKPRDLDEKDVKENKKTKGSSLKTPKAKALLQKHAVTLDK